MNKKMNKVPSDGTKAEKEQKDEDISVTPAIANADVVRSPKSVEPKFNSENVHVNAHVWFHKDWTNTSVFQTKLRDLMIEHQVPRVDMSIDAFSFWEENLPNQ